MDADLQGGAGPPSCWWRSAHPRNVSDEVECSAGRPSARSGADEPSPDSHRVGFDAGSDGAPGQRSPWATPPETQPHFSAQKCFEHSHARVTIERMRLYPVYWSGATNRAETRASRLCPEESKTAHPAGDLLPDPAVGSLLRFASNRLVREYRSRPGGKKPFTPGD